MRKTILLGCNSPRQIASGVAGTVLEIGAGLSNLGWSPEFAFLNSGLHHRVQRQLFYFEVAAKARRSKPDVAVISSGDGALVPLLAARTPLVMQSHGLERLSHAAAQRFGLRDTYGGRGHLLIREPAIEASMKRARMVVVKTNEERDYITHEMGHSEAHIAVIPNGVPDEYFEIQRREASRPTVAWISSWIPRKGSGWLSEIIRRVVSEVPDVEFRLLGTGKSRSAVVAELPSELADSVSVTPFATREQMRSELAQSWVGLFTSAYEGFGKVVPEMLAAGIPVVSTPVGVSPELLSSGENGSLADWGDADSAGDRLSRYLREDAVRLQAGGVARSSVEELRWPTVARLWDDLLRSIA